MGFLGRRPDRLKIHAIKREVEQAHGEKGKPRRSKPSGESNFCHREVS